MTEEKNESLPKTDEKAEWSPSVAVLDLSHLSEVHPAQMRAVFNKYSPMWDGPFG